MSMRIFSRAIFSFSILASAALAGPAHAGLEAGLDAWEAGNKEAAAREWKEGADAGENLSAYLLAKLYETGNGVARNDAKAFEYMKRAAELDHIQAWVELGDMYRRGVPDADVPEDDLLAIHWYEKAALKQHAEAQMKVGEMHWTGLGAERNRFEGIRWFELAAEKYYTPALIRLAEIYWTGDPLDEDKPRAYSLLLNARHGATDETRPKVDELMGEWERQMSRAQIDAGIRLAEAYRAEHPKR